MKARHDARARLCRSAPRGRSCDCGRAVARIVAIAILTFVAAESVNAQQGAAFVAVTQIVQQPVSAGQEFVGTVVPLRRSVVGSAVGGRVVEFSVNEGDRVEKGQPLAQLLRRALEMEREAAKAALEVRRQELQELENGARPEEINQAEAKMLSAKSTMDYANAKLERTRTLFDRRAASQEQLQDEEGMAERGTQAYLDAKAAWELVVAGARAERIAQAKAQVAVAEEEVNRIEDQLEKHTIRAPFNGYVVKEHTEDGQWISSGDPVAEIVDVDSVDVEVPVLENYVTRLQVGAPASVRIAALADRGPFAGRIALIVPQAEVRSRNFPVKVRIENQRLPDGMPLLKPGMMANVALPLDKRDSVLMVPKDALVLDGNVARIFVFDGPSDAKNGKVRAVQVATGISSGAMIEVVGDVQPGMLVVIEGNERLRDGGDVVITSVKQAAAPGDSAAAPRS